MSTHKLIQKSLKLTAVGAIAFSVLAQPLSLVTHAAETAPTKSERQVAQATTQEELLTNSKLDFVDGYPLDTQFFNGWILRNVSNTDDLTNPDGVGSPIEIMEDLPINSGSYVIDVKNNLNPDAGLIHVAKSTSSTGGRELYLFSSSVMATGTYGAIIIYQDVTTEVGKEYTLSQSGTYTVADYNVNIPTPSYGAIPKSTSINVFASNANSKERLALIKATDTNQSTTFVAQSTKTRIYATIGVRSLSRIDRNVLWQSTNTAGNNLFGVSLTASNSGISEAKAATDALFIDNDPTKGIKPTTDQAAIDAAQEKIDNITDDTAKAELQAELDKAQAELDARTAEAQREAEATAATEGLFVDNDPTKNIKDTTTQADIDEAQANIDAVTDEAIKATLQEDLDKAQKQLDEKKAETEAKTAVDALFTDNDPAKSIKDTVTQADIDNAQAKIDTLTDEITKEALQEALDKAQKELNGKISVIAKPVVSPVTNNDTVVKGTGIPGLTISITNGTDTYTGKVAINGTFSITIPLQKADTILTVTQKNGEVSSAIVNVKVSNYIPATAPVVNPVGPFQQAITGNVPEGTKMVRLLVNGIAQRTMAPEADGSFSIYSRFITDGVLNNLRLKAGDIVTVDYGNKTPANLVTNVTVSAELVKPIVNDVVAGTDYITGIVPVGTQTLRLVVNGVPQRTISPQANIDAVTAGGIGPDGKYKIYSRFIVDEEGTSRRLKAGDRVTVDGGVQIPGDTGTTFIVK
ncbi:hypothetical protein HCA78_14325 [Listeria booriae]|uniref:Bacterial Ig domain-containing protein n=1 Tax=Listeria booriae TaxID=1552123 RepID=A0A842CRW6_9LIST|nr:toxin Cry1Ac domain D-VI-related protein [Listeria booriae]MBC2004958.1 hypothetical protein [Listeria booriae]